MTIDKLKLDLAEMDVLAKDFEGPKEMLRAWKITCAMQRMILVCISATGVPVESRLEYELLLNDCFTRMLKAIGPSHTCQ